MTDFTVPNRTTIGTGALALSVTTKSSFDMNLYTPPPRVGTYWLGVPEKDVGFNLTKKPSAWHRFWMRFALGLTWRDAQ